MLRFASLPVIALGVLLTSVSWVAVAGCVAVAVVLMAIDARRTH